MHLTVGARAAIEDPIVTVLAWEYDLVFDVTLVASGEIVIAVFGVMVHIRRIDKVGFSLAAAGCLDPVRDWNTVGPHVVGERRVENKWQGQ